MSLGDNMIDSKKMGKRLKELRKSKGWSQIRMMTETEIDQALISKFENGERIPPPETLVILADFFDTSTDYILGRTDKK